MTITIEIPEELAGQLIAAGQDPARATLEAVALEGYRSDRLSEADIRELLGFETRMEVHGFLKEHGVFLHYTDEDLAHDSEVAIQVRGGLGRSVKETHPISGVPDDRHCRHGADQLSDSDWRH